MLKEPCVTKLIIWGYRSLVAESCKAEATKTTSNKLTTEHTAKSNCLSGDGDLLIGHSFPHT